MLNYLIPGSVFTMAGSPGYADGQGTNAAFLDPTGVAIDSTGVIYVADSSNHIIRMISSSGDICRRLRSYVALEVLMMGYVLYNNLLTITYAC